LDELEDIPGRYVIEVSSPGVERPLTRVRDWSRFRGQRVAVEGLEPLMGDQRRIEGELLGFAEEGDNETESDSERVRIRTDEGDELILSLNEVKRAHLVHEWT